MRSSIPNSETNSAKTDIFAVFLCGARNSDCWILTPLFLHEKLIQILAPREWSLFEIQLTDIWVIHYSDVVYLLIRKQIFIQVLVGKRKVEFGALNLIELVDASFRCVLNTQMGVRRLEKVCVVMVIELNY